MLASSALVLTALTVTGVFVRSSRQKEEENNVLDFSAIESESTQSAENIMPEEDLSTLFTEVGTDDLDYDPSFQEANSDNVENMGKTKKDTDKSDKDRQKESGLETESDNDADGELKPENAGIGTTQKTQDEKKADQKTDSAKKKEENKETDTKKEPAEEEEGMIDESEETMAEEPEDTEALATNVQPVLDFNEEDSLVWPIVGDILINYSMDKTTYFQTLEQYKYNPAIMIAATEGENITAAADGRVVSVSYDRQLGNTVVMDLGNQYELTYGQLQNVMVTEGSYVTTGEIIGNVAAPTKYYSTEGTNVYFKLTKDGEPVNPLSKLY